jgi:hypothetical protein
MWDLIKSFTPAVWVGVVLGFLGFVVGMGAVFAVSWKQGVIITTVSVAVVVFGFWFFFGPEVRRRHLMKNGIAAEATILDVAETGMTVQRNYPIAKIRFLVHPPQGADYEATAKCMMNRFDIPAYQPGSTVNVLIDPRHRDRVTLA